MKYLILHILILLSIIMPVSASDDISSSQMDSIATALSKEIASFTPSFSGQVLSSKGETGVYINIGEIDGLKKGEKFEVYSQGTGTIRDSDGKFVGYESDLLALIEVAWVRDDYSFAEIIKKYSDTPIEQMDILNYVVPEKLIYIGEISGTHGQLLKQQLTEHLNNVKYLSVVEYEFDANILIQGDIITRSRGLDVKIVYKSKTSGQEKLIEKRFILKKESSSTVHGAGYTGYILEEKALDITTSNGKDILILGENHLYRGTLDSDGLNLASKDALTDNEYRSIREPIGRILFFNLDGSGDTELLLGRYPDKLSRYYSRFDDKYKIAGPLPGIPICFSDSGLLLVSTLNEGHNLFMPSQTNLINVSSSGYGGQKNVWNISGPFLDAEFVDLDKNGEFELAVLYPDGSLKIVDPEMEILNIPLSLQGVGLGLYSGSDGFLYASTDHDNDDMIKKYQLLGDKNLALVNQSPILPFHIYRIKKLNGKIVALALDDSDRSVLITFDSFT
ncbi:MAG: hypothetical protein ABIG42_07575 [bacterium]